MKFNQEILELEKTLVKLENLHASFDYLKITIASPQRIKSWAERRLPTGEVVGEVVKAETINFRTYQPELNGLFCEKIFGPIKNWKCKCGKYNGFMLDKVCEECHVEIIEARVRRYRMGYINLTCPITHLWYLKGSPNYLCILLRCFDEKISINNIEQIVYLKEDDNSVLATNSLNQFSYPPKEYEKNNLDSILNKQNLNKFSKNYFNYKTRNKRLGSEVLQTALENINLKLEIKKYRNLVENSNLADFTNILIPEKNLIRRIRILESFLATKINPSWIILTNLPVLPPSLRPLLELENGRLATADINEIYRLIITRNQRLFDFIYHFVAPDLISIHGRKLLQEAVDSLIDNARLPKDKIFCLNNKALKSLTEILEGKQGRFRQSLLGKRVDYSGRSVIIVGPNLRLNQCGLPYEILVELFQPFLINELLKTKIKTPSHNIKLAHIIIKKNKPFIWNLLEVISKKYSILLNRAPTLHRFGIQAFDPVVVLGQAIQLHPLVCTGFNADFDGDQMAVHLPLYDVSQLEIKTLMRPSYNILSPSNGEVILKPTQDMVIGCYYLTLMIARNPFIIQKWFSNEQEALQAFYQKKLTIHTSILVRYNINSFKIKIANKKIEFIDSITNLIINRKSFEILKIYKLGLIYEKYFILTNIGIFIAHKTLNNQYELTDIFLETTAGRLIFNINFKNIIKT